IRRPRCRARAPSPCSACGREPPGTCGASRRQTSCRRYSHEHGTPGGPLTEPELAVEASQRNRPYLAPTPPYGFRRLTGFRRIAKPTYLDLRPDTSQQVDRIHKVITREPGGARSAGCRSVEEVPGTGEIHRHPGVPSRGDDPLVVDRTAGLDDRAHPGGGEH